jgi:hypothetical protein
VFHCNKRKRPNKAYFASLENDDDCRPVCAKPIAWIGQNRKFDLRSSSAWWGQNFIVLNFVTSFRQGSNPTRLFQILFAATALRPASHGCSRNKK